MIMLHKINRKFRSGAVTASFIIIQFFSFAHDLFAQQITVSVNWNNILGISKTIATLQIVGNPRLRTHSSIHDSTFHALRELGAEYVRYVPWFPYPKLAVAELKAPTAHETFWDFNLMDSMMNDFIEATNGHRVVINVSTIPTWLFKTDKEGSYPDDPDQVYWDYNQGTELRDTSLKEVSEYFARVFSWYTQGGFTDELGKYHQSGHHYRIPLWEVLNEPDLEHNFSVQQYTRIYDAVVSAIKKISPSTQFVGMSLAFSNDPEWFEYFLNPKNHLPGIPLDFISYHFYAVPKSDQKIDQYQYSFFDQAEGFLNKVRYIEQIRIRLSPGTKTMINEIGSILGFDLDHIPPEYWTLSGAMYAYIFVELSRIGIEVAGESQLLGFPTQYPDVSMVSWEDGSPNARYWVLKLLKDHFASGNQLVETTTDGENGALAAQAFLTPREHCLLLINKRNRNLKVEIAGNPTIRYLDYAGQPTANEHTKTETTGNNIIQLKPFSVVLVIF